MFDQTLSRRTFLALTAVTALPLVSCRDNPDPTFAVPIDTREHARTWMGWPDSTAIWGGMMTGVQADIARLARRIAKHEPVFLLANSASASAAARACGSRVTIVDTIPLDDCWLRDSGPVFRVDGAGGLDAFGTNFNGWGGRQTHHRDAEVAQRIAEHVGVDFQAASFVGEGGAIETDGTGTLMATASSLVNDNRNPGMTQDDITAAICDAYGAQKVIWFDGIRSHDITDDHVDATSRFIAPASALVQLPHPGDTDIWSNDARSQHDSLSSSTSATGTPLSVETMIGPDYNAIRSHNRGFVGSYANYYVCNRAVIMAEFGDDGADSAAKRRIAELFPDRVVEQVRIDHLGAGGGGIHCVTQQQPVV